MSAFFKTTDHLFLQCLKKAADKPAVCFLISALALPCFALRAKVHSKWMETDFAKYRLAELLHSINKLHNKLKSLVLGIGIISDTENVLSQKKHHNFYQ